MDARRRRLPTRAARAGPTACAFLTALFVLLGLLLAAPARSEALVPPFPVALMATTVAPSHHAAPGALGCHAVACATGLIPASAALEGAAAGNPFVGWPLTGLARPSRALAPDPPPPRP